MINEKRIRKAMKKSFKDARIAIAEARESGTPFAKGLAIEIVTYHRKLNAGRLRALVAGSTVAA